MEIYRKEMEKRHYAPPELTVVSFRAERGYASSAIDAVADELNSWANRLNMQIVGSIEDENLWRAEQDVSGIGNENGMAAGYFYTEQTDGWF